jgi:deoxyribonucleoside regulator
MQGLWVPYRADLVQRGVLTQQQVDQLMSYNPAVDFNHWSFDAEGRCINYMIAPPLYYPTGLEVPRLKERISSGHIKSILVAGGSRAHARAVRAALKAGIANILITDHVTAEMLLHDELW